METQIEYIKSLAIKYSGYVKDPSTLFTDLNKISKTNLEDIFQEYGNKDRKFQPVALVRAEVARMLLNGEEVDEMIVEEIKQNIRDKNIKAFQKYGQKLMDELLDYPMGKRDIFANWHIYWRLLHTLFYRGLVKETVNQYLKQLSNQLISDLNLVDYEAHWVDFYGPSNFGTEHCWIALYPITVKSHKEAFQFFMKIEKDIEVGRIAGSSLKEQDHNDVQIKKNYDEAVKFLADQREETIALNSKIRGHFKFAPGSQASEWERFKEDGIAAVSYKSLNLGDISSVPTRQDLNIKAGLDPEDWTNKTWNLWLFRNANIGDLIFANKGTNTCIGIGIIKGEYYYDGEDVYEHKRKVTWITDKVYQYKTRSYKKYITLFRPDTFSPTLIWGFILSEYLRLYPGLRSEFEKYDILPDEDSIEETGNEDLDNDMDVEPDEEGIQAEFWWLNANPSIWRISSYSEGDRQTYTSRNEKGNKRRIYKHFEAVKPGDLVIGYESTPVKQIKAIYEITRSLHQSDEEGEVIEFELVEKLEVPVHWNEFHNDPGLQECEVIINNQGSLFNLTEDEFDILRNIIDEKNIAQEKKQLSKDIKEYRYNEDPDKPFIPEKDFKEIVELLRRKKNIILQGPPGVGKTFIARKLAYQMMGRKNDSDIEMVQFHQSYSYEDFIQGLRMDKKSVFVKNGSFYTFCQQAHAHPDRNFFMIIDEVNRGNLSKIFGELLMLIEPDKRSESYALKLTYAEDAEETFYIPPNFHIIGTMNTADRSLAIVDYALRRRFAFVQLEPQFSNPSLKAFLTDSGISTKLSEFIISSVNKINETISGDQNLGEGFRIGHSFFCTYNDSISEIDWYNEILKYEIAPLLEEIWFDNKDRVDDMVKILTY